MDDLLVELVVREAVLSRAQRELVGVDEGPQHAALGAERAVAGHDGRQIGGGLIAHLAAMTAAGERPRKGHDAIHGEGGGSYALQTMEQPEVSLYGSMPAAAAKPDVESLR